MYAFLRRLGYRFLLPDETVMPHQLSLADLTCSYSHRASLRHRGVCIEGADSLENVLDFIDWLPKLGFNSFFLQFKEPYIFSGKMVSSYPESNKGSHGTHGKHSCRTATKKCMKL